MESTISVLEVSSKKVREIEYNNKISEPDHVYELGLKYLEGVDREHAVVLMLNTKNVITAISTVAIGSLSSAIIHPREVYKIAIVEGAASIIMIHNHPSGDPTPSGEDITITARLKEAGKIIGIELLDHIIIGEKTFVSLKERGNI